MNAKTNGNKQSKARQYQAQDNTAKTKWTLRHSNFMKLEQDAPWRLVTVKFFRLHFFIEAQPNSRNLNANQETP